MKGQDPGGELLNVRVPMSVFCAHISWFGVQHRQAYFRESIARSGERYLRRLKDSFQAWTLDIAVKQATLPREIANTFNYL